MLPCAHARPYLDLAFCSLLVSAAAAPRHRAEPTTTDRRRVIRFGHPGQDAAFHNHEAQAARTGIELLLKERAPAPRQPKG